MHRLRPSLLAPVLAGAAALALVPGGASGAAKPCVATLKAPTHHPKANRLWPLTVTCRTSSGKPVRATATYQFVYQDQVVATRYPSPKANPKSACSRAGTCRHSPYPFKGKMHDGTFIWPRRSVGFPLTLRVVIAVKGKGSLNLDYTVKVRK
jgi:hypothetical protein